MRIMDRDGSSLALLELPEDLIREIVRAVLKHDLESFFRLSDTCKTVRKLCRSELKIKFRQYGDAGDLVDACYQQTHKNCSQLLSDILVLEPEIHWLKIRPKPRIVRQIIKILLLDGITCYAASYWLNFYREAYMQPGIGDVIKEDHLNLIQNQLYKCIEYRRGKILGAR